MDYFCLLKQIIDTLNGGLAYPTGHDRLAKSLHGSSS
jgi:hypothetical protein